jgi:hypothetical protein
MSQRLRNFHCSGSYQQKTEIKIECMQNRWRTLVLKGGTLVSKLPRLNSTVLVVTVELAISLSQVNFRTIYPLPPPTHTHAILAPTTHEQTSENQPGHCMQNKRWNCNWNKIHLKLIAKKCAIFFDLPINELHRVQLLVFLLLRLVVCN